MSATLLKALETLKEDIEKIRGKAISRQEISLDTSAGRKLYANPALLSSDMTTNISISEVEYTNSASADDYTNNALQAIWNIADGAHKIVAAKGLLATGIALKNNSTFIQNNFIYLDSETWVPKIFNQQTLLAAKALQKYFLTVGSEEQALDILTFDALKKKAKASLEYMQNLLNLRVKYYENHTEKKVAEQLDYLKQINMVSLELSMFEAKLGLINFSTVEQLVSEPLTNNIEKLNELLAIQKFCNDFDIEATLAFPNLLENSKPNTEIPDSIVVSAFVNYRHCNDLSKIKPAWLQLYNLDEHPMEFQFSVGNELSTIYTVEANYQSLKRNIAKIEEKITDAIQSLVEEFKPHLPRTLKDKSLLTEQDQSDTRASLTTFINQINEIKENILSQFKTKYAANQDSHQETSELILARASSNLDTTFNELVQEAEKQLDDLNSILILQAYEKAVDDFLAKYNRLQQNTEAPVAPLSQDTNQKNRLEADLNSYDKAIEELQSGIQELTSLRDTAQEEYDQFQQQHPEPNVVVPPFYQDEYAKLPKANQHLTALDQKLQEMRDTVQTLTVKKQEVESELGKVSKENRLYVLSKTEADYLLQKEKVDVADRHEKKTYQELSRARVNYDRNVNERFDEPLAKISQEKTQLTQKISQAEDEIKAYELEINTIPETFEARKQEIREDYMYLFPFVSFSYSSGLDMHEKRLKQLDVDLPKHLKITDEDTLTQVKDFITSVQKANQPSRNILSAIANSIRAVYGLNRETQLNKDKFMEIINNKIAEIEHELKVSLDKPITKEASSPPPPQTLYALHQRYQLAKERTERIEKNREELATAQGELALAIESEQKLLQAKDEFEKKNLHPPQEFHHQLAKLQHLEANIRQDLAELEFNTLSVQYREFELQDELTQLSSSAVEPDTQRQTAVESLKDLPSAESDELLLDRIRLKKEEYTRDATALRATFTESYNQYSRQFFERENRQPGLPNNIDDIIQQRTNTITQARENISQHEKSLAQLKQLIEIKKTVQKLLSTANIPPDSVQQIIENTRQVSLHSNDNKNPLIQSQLKSIGEETVNLIQTLLTSINSEYEQLIQDAEQDKSKSTLAENIVDRMTYYSPFLRSVNDGEPFSENLQKIREQQDALILLLNVKLIKIRDTYTALLEKSRSTEEYIQIGINLEIPMLLKEHEQFLIKVKQLNNQSIDTEIETITKLTDGKNGLQEFLLTKQIEKYTKESENLAEEIKRTSTSVPIFREQIEELNLIKCKIHSNHAELLRECHSYPQLKQKVENIEAAINREFDKLRQLDQLSSSLEYLSSVYFKDDTTKNGQFSQFLHRDTTEKIKDFFGQLAALMCGCFTYKTASQERKEYVDTLQTAFNDYKQNPGDATYNQLTKIIEQGKTQFPTKNKFLSCILEKIERTVNKVTVAEPAPTAGVEH